MGIISAFICVRQLSVKRLILEQGTPYDTANVAICFVKQNAINLAVNYS